MKIPPFSIKEKYIRFINKKCFTCKYTYKKENVWVVTYNYKYPSSKLLNIHRVFKPQSFTYNYFCKHCFPTREHLHSWLTSYAQKPKPPKPASSKNQEYSSDS